MTAAIKSPSRAATILLAEDEEMVRRLTCNMLLRMGYLVIEASDGREALDRIDQRHGEGVDLLLTDIVMPRMDGQALADEVHERYPEIKILITSGYCETVRGISRNENQFLPKPFGVEDLRRKLEGLLTAQV